MNRKERRAGMARKTTDTDSVGNWRSMLGEIYASKKTRPEDFVLVDLDLSTDIGWGTYSLLAPQAAATASAARTTGHLFVAARFDMWREWVSTHFNSELAGILDERRRHGCTIMFGVLEESPSTPGGFGEVFYRVGLARPDEKTGAEWLEGETSVEVRAS